MNRLTFAVALASIACSTTGAIDAGWDASLDATAPRRDAGPPPAPPVFDTSTTWHAAALECPDGVARREGRDLGAQRRFALSVLHYNIQYVAGGMDNFIFARGEPFDGWTDDLVQDAIVTESLVPVLDMLDRHPSWTLSIEMQGYLVEILLARHRGVAQHLSDLVRGGQVELLSFHYSDQLFLAYPRHHMEISREINAAVLGDACIEASPPVFTQEGQFGVGMADLLGSGSTVIIPKNLFRLFQGDGPVAPYYEWNGVPIVVGGRGATDAASGFESQFVYADDAELLATNGVNPYFPTTFVYVPAALAEFETRLEGLETDGWTIAGISDWVASLESAGVAPTPLPAVLDGTWQPDDTGNVARWMGDGGGFQPIERDNGILAGNTRAGRMVLAAETALEAARVGGVAPPGGDEELTRAWRDLLLGEVSDTTGWNPIPGEVYYGLFHQSAATERARSLAIASAAALGFPPPFVVHTSDGSITAPAPPVILDDVTAAPVTVTTRPTDRPVTMRWQRFADEADHYVLSVEVPAADGEVAISFPWTLDVVRFTPALLDGTTLDVPVAALSLTTTAIPVASGPFGLADDLWLVLDTTTMNLAARIDTVEHTVTFRDRTHPAEVTTWQIHVVTAGADRASEIAEHLLTSPDVLVEAAP